MNKSHQFKYLGNILKLGFRYAKKGYLLYYSIYNDKPMSEEYRWFRAGYLTYTMLCKIKNIKKTLVMD